MNIKSLGSQVAALDTLQKGERAKDVKSEASFKDRDGNGRRDPDQEPTKQHLSDEEMEQALDHLKNLKGVKDHFLKIRVEQTDEHKIVYVEDAYGKVIRRITEPELYLLIRQQDKRTGQIFDKAM